MFTYVQSFSSLFGGRNGPFGSLPVQFLTRELHHSHNSDMGIILKKKQILKIISQFAKTVFAYFDKNFDGQVCL